MLAMLDEPHVKKWWGDPDHEWELILQGEESGESRGFCVWLKGVFVGYVQCWKPGWDEAHFDIEPWQRDAPNGTLGVDISLGQKGLGYGAAILLSFAEKLFAEGVPRLTIDPDIANLRAIAAYKKAHFCVFDESYCDSHSVLLMELTPQMLPNKG